MADTAVRSTRLSSPVLVGRDHEIKLLLDAVKSPPIIVTLEGEPGIGKTRLIRELLDFPELQSRTALVGHCHRLREPFPLGPVVESLRSLGEDIARLPLSPLTGSLRPLLPELADRLPDQPPPLGDPAMERHRLFRAFAEILTSVGPMILVLEDLHWVDDATVEFLRFFISQQPEQAALILTFRREDVIPSSPVTGLTSRLPSSTSRLRLSLAPLGPQDVEELIGSILETDRITEEFTRLMHDRTSGIPFAIEEVLRLLQERRDVIRLSGRWARKNVDDLQVPAAIRESIHERIELLGPDGRRVVQAAAVTGVPERADVLAKVSGLAPSRMTPALVEALQIALVQEMGDGRYALRHELAKQAVYEAIPVPERRELHLRAGDALEAADASGHSAQLAYHFKEANEVSRWAATRKRRPTSPRRCGTIRRRHAS